MSAATKLSEAKFFLELLDSLEIRKSSLTEGASCAEEASFLLSAILNALYSALEQAKPHLGVETIRTYKSQHHAIFSGKGALRNVTVHDRHVDPDHSGYIPPAGDAVGLDFRPKTKLLREAESALPSGTVNLPLGPNHYVEIGGKLRDITEFCHEQYYALETFFQERGIVT